MDIKYLVFQTIMYKNFIINFSMCNMICKLKFRVVKAIIIDIDSILLLNINIFYLFIHSFNLCT